MSTLHSYVFNNVSGLRSDMVDQTQVNVQNTKFGSYSVSNYFSDSASNTQVDFATQHHGNQKNTIKKGDIEFKNVKYRYDKSNNEFLFDDLSLKIAGGKKIGLIGRSGSGKSTLMKMLIGLYKPENGEIFIDGVNIHDMDFQYLRNNVNYVNQKTNLFDETVLYNMLYGNDHISENELLEKLEQ